MKQVTDSKLEIEKFLIDNNCTLLMQFIRGSHLYGLNDENSDIDITFIYQQSTDDILKGNYLPNVNLDNNNITGYEIGRYIELLVVNNPNILESLDIQDSCLLYKDDRMELILSDEAKSKAISKLCKDTILGYGRSQITKATGLNKHMNSDMSEIKKSILDFCYIIEGQKSIPFLDYYNPIKYDFEGVIKTYGLVAVPNGKGIYAIYAGLEDDNMRGIIKDLNSTELRLSSISKSVAERQKPVIMWYNLDGFQKYCKEYKSFIEWKTNRNEQRFKLNQEAGQNVDLKNMMHLFRLLEMANILSTEKVIKVIPKDREFLLNIKKGKYNYKELLTTTEIITKGIEESFESCDLRDLPDYEYFKDILLKFRKYDYSN